MQTVRGMRVQEQQLWGMTCCAFFGLAGSGGRSLWSCTSQPAVEGDTCGLAAAAHSISCIRFTEGGVSALTTLSTRYA